jgi:hypothetical protein
VRDPDRGRVAATRQSRRRRVVLEHVIEHCVRPARHSEPPREDHDRRRGGVHAGRTRAWFANPQRFAFRVVVSTGGASSESDSNSGARTGTKCSAARARDFTNDCSSRITRGEQEQVVELKGSVLIGSV